MDSSLEHAASYTKAGHPFFFLGARGEAGTRNLALKVEGNGEVLRVGPSEWMSVVASRHRRVVCDAHFSPWRRTWHPR